MFCPPEPRAPAPARPLPDWIEWKRHQIWIYDITIWIYDITHFPRAGRVAYAILDVVTRKWLATHLTAEETATQVEVVFTEALDTEGLWPAVEARGVLDHLQHTDLRQVQPNCHNIASHRGPPGSLISQSPIPAGPRPLLRDPQPPTSPRFREGSAFPQRCFAFDEFGPLTIRPVAGAGWGLAGRPPLIAANYHKAHGVRQFHGCYSIGEDVLWGVVRQRKSAANTLAALKSIRARHSDGEWIYVILDNLSAHKGRAVRQWARGNRVELCFTPTYSSWANPIEAHFGPLREFVLNNSQHPNHTVLTRRLHAYLRWRNANARDPDLLAAQRRQRARTRAEKGHRWGRPLPQAA